MKFAIYISLLMLLSSLNLFSHENKGISNSVGVSYNLYKKTDDYKNSFVCIDWLLMQKNEDLLKFGIEFKLMGSLVKNANPMISFATIPTLALDVYDFQFEFGTGALLNHENGNKIGKHSIATKIMLTSMKIGKFSLRGGGYIISNSPSNGLASIGILYEF